MSGIVARIITRIPPVPSGAPTPIPTPVEAPIPAPAPIGRVIPAQVETRIPVGASPIAPRSHIYGRYRYVAPDNGYVVETGAVNPVKQKCGVVVIVVIGCRTNVVRLVEHCKFALIRAFISVGVAVHVFVVAESFQRYAVLSVGFGKHGFYT